MEHKSISQLDRMRASTNVIGDAEYKEAFQNVSHVAAEILARTLGPYAHTTIIDDGSYRYSTKDGWSIANRILFNDALANSLFSFIKTISFNLVSKVGDGTTTAIVAADKFIRNMAKTDQFKNVRQKDLLEDLETAKETIIQMLKNGGYIHTIQQDGDMEDIYRIAYTSTNGNEKIASMIKQIYLETHNPTIYVNIGNDIETTMEIQNGYRFDCNPIMLKNYTNTDTKEFKTDVGNARAIFFNHNVNYVTHRRMIEEILTMVQDAPALRGMTIILIAPYFDDTLSGAINNANNKFVANGLNPPIMMIQVPMMNTVQKHFYNDFRAVIGNLFLEESAVEMFNRLKDPDKFTDESQEAFKDNFSNLAGYHSCRELIMDYLKPMDHCTIGKDFILVEKYDRNSKDFKEVFEDAKKNYEEELAESAKRMTDLDRTFMNASMRYTRICGKMGIINVGGASELERKCLKDSVDDAVLASRSAYENGYVAGMNLSIISAIAACKKEYTDPQFNAIYDLLMRSFMDTDMEIIRNMMPNWSDEEIDKYLCPVFQRAIQNKYGFDLVREEFEDPNHLTVINSVMTDIEILKSVVSILGYSLTSNQMISMTRSFDRDVFTKVKESEETEKYYRIGKAIAEAMKDSKIFPDVKPLVVQRDFQKNDIDPGFYQEIPCVSPMTEITKKTDLNPHEKIELPEWATRHETTPFKENLGPTSTVDIQWAKRQSSTGDKIPNLGKTICHTGEVPSVFYGKTSGDTINISDVDQRIID